MSLLSDLTTLQNTVDDLIVEAGTALAQANTDADGAKIRAFTDVRDFANSLEALIEGELGVRAIGQATQVN